MKFITSNQTLGRGISAVQNAVGSALSNPIVENIHISCIGDKVRFLATNLNLTINCEGEANVLEEGEIVLPSKVIVNVIRDLPKGEVEFNEENETVRLTCGEFSAKLKGQPGELFPPFTMLEEGIDLQLEIEKLKEIIRKTIFATSTEKSRYELDGVKFELKEKKMLCISTDGRRLAFFSIIGESFPEIEFSAMIPTKTLQEVNNSMPDAGQVTMRVSERKVQFTCGDTTIISNLLVDNFPQYDRIIPEPSGNKIFIKRDDLVFAVKRAANLTSTDTNMILFKINSGEVEICGEREEVGGEGKDKIKAEYQGESMEARYNHRFLMDFLRVISEDTIELDLANPKRPGVFRGKGTEEFQYILMPMRPPEKAEQTEEEESAEPAEQTE